MAMTEVRDNAGVIAPPPLIALAAVVLGLAQTAGFILLNAFTFIIGSALVALIDVGVLYFATRVFQREKILTQWK